MSYRSRCKRAWVKSERRRMAHEWMCIRGCVGFGSVVFKRSLSAPMHAKFMKARMKWFGVTIKVEQTV